MVRESGTLTGYYWNDGWAQIGTGSGPTGDIYFGISAWSTDGFFGDQVVSASFDNLFGFDRPKAGIGPRIGVPDSGGTIPLMLAALVCVIGLQHCKRTSNDHLDDFAGGDGTWCRHPHRRTMT
jgi:hypothetical protein